MKLRILTLFSRWQFATWHLCDGSKFYPICERCDWIVGDGEPYLTVYTPLLLQRHYLCVETHHGEASCAARWGLAR